MVSGPPGRLRTISGRCDINWTLICFAAVRFDIISTYQWLVSGSHSFHVKLNMPLPGSPADLGNEAVANSFSSKPSEGLWQTPKPWIRVYLNPSLRVSRFLPSGGRIRPTTDWRPGWKRPSGPLINNLSMEGLASRGRPTLPLLGIVGA